MKQQRMLGFQVERLDLKPLGFASRIQFSGLGSGRVPCQL